MQKTLLETIKEKRLLGDGGMGTQLMQAGLESGSCGEAWNLACPEKVVSIQRNYVEAGTDCIITNTFGGCRIMLERHGQQVNVKELNAAAVEIAREAFGDKAGFVIGDVGPFGGIMEPYGDTKESDVREAITEQVEALVGAGADAIIIETQTSFEELGIGLEAAKNAGAPCIIGSMAYDVTFDGENFRTMMGIDPEQAAEFMQEKGADIVALNCGTGMDMIRAAEATSRYKAACDLPVMAQPNAGLPELINQVVVYKETPEEMVKNLQGLLDAGASIIGACCGSTPAHIKALRSALDNYGN